MDKEEFILESIAGWLNTSVEVLLYMLEWLNK